MRPPTIPLIPPRYAPLRKSSPSAGRIVLFESSFFQRAAPVWKRYAIQVRWDEIGVRRNSFHGAAHKYAAERAAELCGRRDALESAKMLYAAGAHAS